MANYKIQIRTKLRFNKFNWKVEQPLLHPYFTRWTKFGPMTNS